MWLRSFKRNNLTSHQQAHYGDLEDEKQNHQQKTEDGIQYEDNEKDINDLKLERLSQKAISQNTDSSIQKLVNILKIQNDESRNSEKIKMTEKNIEMHKGHRDINAFE